ncbi:hypothetical protein B0H13DRAFT_1883208 [Mycena leptocephala]|nr:hypothetical protein B0H13DRAFT_1883208 [Mycena leptocephala]
MSPIFAYPIRFPGCYLTDVAHFKSPRNLVGTETTSLENKGVLDAPRVVVRRGPVPALTFTNSLPFSRALAPFKYPVMVLNFAMDLLDITTFHPNPFTLSIWSLACRMPNCRQLFNPMMDELNSLIYLERVIQESLRVYSSVTFRHRMAMQDDVLPLSKPYVDKHGIAHTSLLNLEHPERADDIHPDPGHQQGQRYLGSRCERVEAGALGRNSRQRRRHSTVWTNLLTFFAGPHNCVGFRFAVLEIKPMPFTVIRAFEVQTAVQEGGIVRSAGTPQRPTVLAKGSKRSNLPLILKAYEPHNL